MSYIIKEQLIDGMPIPIPVKGLKTILYQIENCVCKIYKDIIKGTGFFCKIPYKNNILHLLITNNHILNKHDIEDNKIINISVNNNPKVITIDKTRKKYTNRELDFTFIEIKPNEDNIHNFLEIDEEDINKSNINLEYINKSIYLLHYPKGDLSISCGVIKKIKESEIAYLCNTEEGSSGCPILSINSYKVIGIRNTFWWL